MSGVERRRASSGGSTSGQVLGKGTRVAEPGWCPSARRGQLAGLREGEWLPRTGCQVDSLLQTAQVPVLASPVKQAGCG